MKNEAKATMLELGPENTAEVLLAIQMIGVHEAAMTFLRAATRKGQYFDGADANVTCAIRLIRLFIEQLDTSLKLKKKPPQKLTVVENVHVHSGGQAIVGVVSTSNGETHED